MTQICVAVHIQPFISHALYLAISDTVYEKLFRLKAIQMIVKRYKIALVVVKIEEEEVVEWIE